jgi:hypothetical protein
MTAALGLVIPSKYVPIYPDGDGRALCYTAPMSDRTRAEDVSS